MITRRVGPLERARGSCRDRPRGARARSGRPVDTARARRARRARGSRRGDGRAPRRFRPTSTSRSCAYWRIDSRRRNLASVCSSCSSWTSDLSTRRESSSSTAKRSMRSSAHTASAASRVKPPANTEKPPQHRPLVLVEEVVTPRDRRFEGLLARHHRAASAGQEPEPVVERGGDARRVHHPDTRGSELDREREAVEPSTDPADRLQLLLVGCEARPDVPAPAPRRGARRTPRRATERATRSPRGLPSGSRLVATTRRSGARDEQVPRAARAVPSSTCSQLSRTRSVVGDRAVARPECPASGRSCSSRRPTASAMRRSDELGVTHRRELDPPHPAGVTISGIGCRSGARAASCRIRPCR